ncbi:MAG: ribonuclease III [Nitrospinae bacterium CG11_big_fil_rev_8_21_14_0_20_45_15]|nr:MAG: ribonuclease III [Nitrospinae bacterium CG11_big_fil_rev_8_21_14_0_20_45_15]
MLPERRLEELDLLQDRLGYRFNDVELLNKALTHKSYTHENKEQFRHNERFEFLGDSVLDLIVSDFMVRRYSEYNEGVLSKIRAAVVNETSLAGFAREIDLGRFLLLGRGEENTGGRDKSSLLANAFEALAGAIFFDGQLEPVRRALFPFLKKEIERNDGAAFFRDFKSDLQEYTQNKLNCVPVYKVVGESGPDHDKLFEVAVWVKKNLQGKGVGKTKKEAEQSAAMMALESFRTNEL